MRQGNLAVAPLYHQGIERTNFETKVDRVSTSLLKGVRLGSHPPDLLAQLSSSGHLSKNNIVNALNSTDRRTGTSLTPDELAQMISSDYMKISDAAKILSERRVSETAAARTFVSLYSRSPERLAALMLCPEISSLRLAQIIDSAIVEEKAGAEVPGGRGFSSMMVEMLKTYIPPSAAPEILYYVDIGFAGKMLDALNDPALAERIIRAAEGYSPRSSTGLEEFHEALIYNPVNRFGEEHQHPAVGPHYEREDFPEVYSEEQLKQANKTIFLESIIRHINDINFEDNAGGLNREDKAELAREKLILMKNAALAVKLLEPDKAAEILSRRNAREMAEELLSTGAIPEEQRAVILGSKNFDRDSAAHIMAEMPVTTLVSILERPDIQTNPIVSYDRIISLIKSRHFSLGKALSLFRHPGFTRAAILLGDSRNIGDVLMNAILYYFPKEDARDLITRSARNEAQLKDVLADMYEPSINEPCVP